MTDKRFGLGRLKAGRHNIWDNKAREDNAADALPNRGLVCAIGPTYAKTVVEALNFFNEYGPHGGELLTPTEETRRFHGERIAARREANNSPESETT